MRKKICRIFNKKSTKRRIISKLYNKMDKALEMKDLEYVTILGTKVQKIMKL